MKKSRIIFFIILICIILYFIKVKQKEKYKIEIYDLDNLYDDSEVAPRIIPIRHELNDLGYIINNKDRNLYLQCRKPFDKNLQNEYGKLIDDLVKKHKLGAPSFCVFRMGSTPHRVLAHFDAVDRYIYMVRGQKETLIFRLDHLGVDEQVNFLHNVKDLRMKDLIEYLKQNDIDSNYHLLKEGDLFHINPGDYHYIENNTVGDYTIAINLDYETSNDVSSVWDYMWKNGCDWCE
jgi:hypothetical protein